MANTCNKSGGGLYHIQDPNHCHTVRGAKYDWTIVESINNVHKPGDLSTNTGAALDLGNRENKLTGLRKDV